MPGYRLIFGGDRPAEPGRPLHRHRKGPRRPGSRHGAGHGAGAEKRVLRSRLTQYCVTVFSRSKTNKKEDIV